VWGGGGDLNNYALDLLLFGVFVRTSKIGYRVDTVPVRVR
jgi:hypothetical protein